MTFIVKKHKNLDNQIILAIIDKNLLGKTFEEENKILDCSSEFYNGTEMNEDEILKMLPAVNQINIVGEKIFSFLKKQEYAETKYEIQGIPFSFIIINRD